MEERTLVFALLALGLAIIPIQMYFANQNFEQIRESGGPIVISALLCSKANGTYLLSSPASPEKCNSIMRLYRNTNRDVCELFDEVQSSACQRIVSIADERKLDCAQGLLSGKYSYVDGSPEAEWLCNELISG
ncbi:MAG: hypothetical protein ABH863_00855 [Candidatus Micrarchaeota archaeon]